MVADSGALRVRRAKAHRAGDHRLCKACAAVRARRAVLAEVQRVEPVGDAEAELRALAARLVVACRADPGNAMLARELRMTLEALLPAGDADGEHDDLFGDLQP